jgi:hypothetical protein
VRLSKVARSRDTGQHARPELPVIAAGVAADVPGLWKSPGDGRVRTADQQAGPWRNVVAPDRTIVQTALRYIFQIGVT